MVVERNVLLFFYYAVLLYARLTPPVFVCPTQVATEPGPYRTLGVYIPLPPLFVFLFCFLPTTSDSASLLPFKLPNHGDLFLSICVCTSQLFRRFSVILCLWTEFRSTFVLYSDRRRCRLVLVFFFSCRLLRFPPHFAK